MFKTARILFFAVGFLFYSVAISNVWAQSANFVKVSLESITTRATSEIYVNPPIGDVVLGGIPFYIHPTHNMAVPLGGGNALDISVNVSNTTKVFLLLNSYNTWYYYNNQKTGEIKLEFSDSSVYAKDIIVGGNIREWREGNDIIPTVNWVTDPASQEIFRGMPTHLAPPAVMDMLTLDLPTNFAGKTLTKVTIADTTFGDPGIIWMGLTVWQSSGLNVPYFSQKDPVWGSQEYDHANTIGPFFCGATLAGCGCAVTSAAMLLKYYGVDKSPDGQPTTPGTLNSWLKSQSDGYINGDTNFQVITRYAEKANKIFGTPKIDYLGRINQQNFAVLNSDLSSNKPVVLQVPGHFIVATGISGATYTINDPRSTSATTLEDYGNSFQGMRRYSLTNTDLSALLLSIPSPGNFLIIDSQGRKLGKDPVTGEVFNQIPNGNYYLQEPITDDTSANPVAPPEGSGNFYIEILDPQADDYLVQAEGENSDVIFLAYDQNADVSGRTFMIQGQQEFQLNYSPEPGSQIEITQIVDIDIKPKDNANLIKLKEDKDDGKKIEAAILTTPNFDATTVDIESVRFGPNEAKEIHLAKKEKNLDKKHFKDVDKDKDEDLILHFRLRDTGIKVGDTQACLTGKTKTGTLIQGCDSIRLVIENDNEDGDD